MKKLFFLLIPLFLVHFSCTKGRNVRGIEVSQEIIDGSDMNGIDYCFLYGKALDGDSSSIKEYSTIKIFDGGFIYVHGVYLIRLIDRIGDNLFVKALEGIDKSQKSLIGTYIIAGMDIYDNYSTGEGARNYKSIKDYWDKHPQIWSIVGRTQGGP